MQGISEPIKRALTQVGIAFAMNMTEFIFLRNVKSHKLNVVLNFIQVQHAITFLMRSNEKALASTQVESGSVIKSAASQNKHCLKQ